MLNDEFANGTPESRDFIKLGFGIVFSDHRTRNQWLTLAASQFTIRRRVYTDTHSHTTQIHPRNGERQSEERLKHNTKM